MNEEKPKPLTLTPGQEEMEKRLSEMSPAERERMEKLKVIMEEKADKMAFKKNLRLREQQKQKERRRKKVQMEKKSRKKNRKKK